MRSRRELLILAVAILSLEKLAAAAQAAPLVDPLVECTCTKSSIAPLHYAVAKRIVDVIGSTVLLLLLAPLLFLIAVMVWLNSPGPVFFVQKRVGRNGELFDMYKFRSMHTTAPRYELSPTQSSDPRITAVGRFIRRTSLDELPQLINVFVGNMSLVGPRPEMPFIVRRYDSRQRQRLKVVPGITGLWQLSADRGLPIHENIHYDLTYIENRSFFMDLAILIHTPFRVLRGGI
jgi:lipopolysaccharide/colanic/teichoic acid biosynthesis glycosyltransferase